MPEVDKSDVAEFVRLRGLYFDNAEIAARTGYSESTVGKYLRQVQAEVTEAGRDPREVHYEYALGNIFAGGTLRNVALTLSQMDE